MFLPPERVKKMTMADKLRKVDKEYVLSDSTVNCYGFRLLTSGYQLPEFQRNPIGYYMHSREDGVAVKWDNLRVDGDVIYGTPCINLSNKRGQQTLDEVEDGFLNAASMGHFVVLEYSMDVKDMVAGQTGPTVTKWYNKECSLVDIPGNENALACLFDTEGNELKLEDLMAGNAAGIVLKSANKNENFNHNHMEGVVITLADLQGAGIKTEGIPSFQNLGAGADKAGVLLIIKGLAGERDTAVQGLADHKKAAVEKEVKDMLETALTDKKITVALKDSFAKDYATNPDGLKVVLSNLKGYTSVVDKLADKAKGDVAKYEGKSYDELMESSLLGEVKANHPDLYKKVYNEAFPESPLA